jgi:8-oxo-dGTP diphosphatase
MLNCIKNYFFFFVIVLSPLVGQATDQTITQAHKPPILTTTAIIEVYEEGQFKGIVLIERGKAPFGKAIPGGKVEYGETVENAVRREMMEEVNLNLSDLKQFHVYSDPSRDFRHHSVEVAHVAKAYELPKAGDDAAQAFVVKLEDIPWSELAFDHAQVLKDYMDWRNGNHSLSIIKH